MGQVSLNGIRKVYPNGFSAIKGADLEIRDGEFMVLVGPSGCGKSTLLRMIAGLEEISGGEMHIGDQMVNFTPPRDRRIAMVFQNYALYPHMTVEQNLGFGLKNQKVPKAEIRERVAEVAEMLELDEILKRKPKQLSGGQRQRVAVGRAIVRDAEVYLFDEPLSNLDASLRVAMRSELTKLHRKLAKTMVYVTHDQTEAMTMGDRITVLKDGVIQQVDTPLNLYHYPVNSFVAGFIGSPAMNFVEGSLVQVESQLRFQNDSGQFDFPVPQAAAERLSARAGERIALGIRPEHFYEQGTHGLTEFAEVTLSPDIVELMGNEVVLHAETKGGALCVRDLFPHPPKAGDEVPLALDLANLHFFETETGECLARTVKAD